MADLSDPSVAGPYGALAALAAAIAGALGFGRGKATAPKGGGVAGLGERVGALEQKAAVVQALYEARENGMKAQRGELDVLEKDSATHSQQLRDIERRLDRLESKS